MSRGVLIFAFNSPNCNYYDMAVATAKRVNHFLNLPVTVITDKKSLPETESYQFDNTVIIESDHTNKRSGNIWVNKGRYQAYDLSPYSETLLLDTDYLVNSDTLLKTFDLPTDFCCHDSTKFLMHPESLPETLSPYSFTTLWATVVRFSKTARSKQIFDALKMIQQNYEHYSNIHGFIATSYRNDYALTLALRLVNGHYDRAEDIIPWDLVHIGKNTTLVRNSDNEFNASYTVIYDNWKRNKVKKEQILINDFDFHMINKENFMEIV